MQKLSFLIFGTLLALTSCTKETPIANVDCSTVTFSNVIFPIFEQNCNLSGCHGGNTYNGTFTSYNNIKTIVNNGQLRSTVLDFRTMPQGGSLTSEQLGQIQCWLDDGAPQ
ncbi:MAG: hypothetical protein KDC85_05145 [Saprospiraceae bacterium]|nr:hypothetical protein [Saprospiraceae bacterium]MCB9325016.1 hypothetical protein [Lewinellaceae bacterium]